MNRIGRTLWLARIPSLSAFSSFVTATVASLALLGWMSDNQLLRGFSQPVAMNPTVAAALIAAAAALWLSRGHRGPIGPKIGTGLALLVLLAAFAKLFSYATGWGIPLDTGLFRSELSGNEMAPNSAVGLLLASSAIILLGKRFRGGYEPATWLASVSAGISLVAMAGYYNGLSSLFGIGAFIPMALNTALAVFVLSVGIVWSSAHGTPGAGKRFIDETRMNRTLERRIALGFGAALFVLCVIAIISFKSIRQFVAKSQWEDHTRQVLLAITDLASSVTGAETAGRGYIISADDDFLLPYHTAADRSLAEVEELRALTSDNPAQQRRLGRLQPLLAQKLDILTSSVEARKAGGFAAAQRRVLDGQGKRAMKEIMGILGEMRGAEESLLKARSTEALSSARATTMVISVGSGLAVLLVAMAAVLIRRDIRGRGRAEEALRQTEEKLRLLIESVKDYAIFMLDPSGRITSWNPGAERINGYAANEIVGRHFSRFYPEQDVQRGKCETELRIAADTGRYEEEGWRIRKDGAPFWASVVISAVHDETGNLRGFAKVTRDITDRKRAEDDVRRLNDSLKRHSNQLEGANKELEAFCYSVSHDLRAPLRSIDGFSLALMEDHADKLDPEARDYLQRVRGATKRMAQLIDDLLQLSRVTRSELSRSTVDLSETARAVVAQLQRTQTDRRVQNQIQEGLVVEGDSRLLRVVLDNLLGNAWKFTSHKPDARIEFGASGTNGGRRFFVRDNGAGFDMAYVHKLFGAFQRLHANDQFPGTGVGLATVQRIIHRHGGQITAEGEVEKGATFHFTV